MTHDTLMRLAATIAARRASTSVASYTKALLDKGVPACARKLGEEAVETVIAALSEPDDKLRGEAADLLFHLLVLLEARNIPLDEVFRELEARMSQSGHAEKAARIKDERAA
jgi:phosphoribosyl-ATP pyrophosphohydrolase